MVHITTQAELNSPFAVITMLCGTTIGREKTYGFTLDMSEADCRDCLTKGS